MSFFLFIYLFFCDAKMASLFINLLDVGLGWCASGEFEAVVKTWRGNEYGVIQVKGWLEMGCPVGYHSFLFVHLAAQLDTVTEIEM